ncbi:MAG: bifunctional glycosyltransferase family 2/GtrA family protein [Lachnospiraceae bacterium]|nr:bifunctional glycosyltransferase family 2/GtrA family protein [Lachnospiraceae bacterium]
MKRYILKLIKKAWLLIMEKLEKQMKYMDAKEVPVIIPSYEPDEKLIKLLGDLRDEGFKHLLLVDDGSGEAYRHFFEQAKSDFDCDVMHHAVNLGKGRALKTAFNYVLQKFPDAPGCITADSDGQHSPECILACAEALLEHPDALIMGCRCFDKENVPARSEFGNKCTRVVMKYLAGVSVSDTQTGLRGIPAFFMKELLSVKGERFEFETNMLIETKADKIPIIEVPIQTIYIEENKTSHFNPIKDSIKIYMIFGKFLFSSLSSSVVDLVLFSMFCYLLKGRQWGSITYLTAATVFARVLSAIYNYSLNYKVVFQSKSSLPSTMARYFLLAVVQMSLSAFLVNKLYPLFGGAEVLVKIPVDVLLFFISFFIQREFVYSGSAGQK